MAASIRLLDRKFEYAIGAQLVGSLCRGGAKFDESLMSAI